MFEFQIVLMSNRFNEWVANNRIPLLCGKGSGIATGQTMQIATKKCMAKSCFDVQKKQFFKRIQRFFAAILTGKDESNVDTWEVYGGPLLS